MDIHCTNTKICAYIVQTQKQYYFVSAQRHVHILYKRIGTHLLSKTEVCTYIVQNKHNGMHIHLCSYRDKHDQQGVENFKSLQGDKEGVGVNLYLV
jgi:hypothetical protein